MEINYYKKVFDICLPEYNQMFKNEINMMIFLLKNKIKCIPKILKVKIQSNYKEIFYERIEGKTLNEIDISRMILKDKLILFSKILKSVKEIHKLGLIHNDINLSNIIVNENTIYLIDFSESRFIKEVYLKKYFSYTEGFSSIEKYSNLEKNYIENDTYSLTSILYFLLFNKKYPKICDSNFLKIKHENKLIEKFLKMGLSFNRINRFENIEIMEEKISGIIEKL